MRRAPTPTLLAAAGRVGASRTARVLAAIVFALTALGVGPGSVPAPARAATPDLTLVTDTTYEVRPDEGRVAVTVRITATNRLRDTVTRRFFFEEGYLSVLPGASNFALSASSGSPTVTVSSRRDAGVLLRLRFGSRLAAGTSTDLTLTFDLADPGGPPDRPLRISPSLVLFQAWAYATEETPGSTVEVRVPAGYTVVLDRGPLVMQPSDAAGWQVFASGPLDSPLTFAADISADRPGLSVDGRRSTTVGEGTVVVVLRAWPDDPGWRARVGDLVLGSLPTLGAAIGVPWPRGRELTVAETIARGQGGDAGAFDPARALVEVGYTASPGVVLHALAHAWFNGSLVADRWIAEAFAALYAEDAAAALGEEARSPDFADGQAGTGFPLNAWRPAGEAAASEDAYGFAAALVVGREIRDLVGDDALRATWRAAAARQPAYQPGTNAEGAAPESGAEPPDWRALLDLLEENADPGAAMSLERLWRRWIVRPADAPLLDARAAARRRYAETVAAAAPWTLPRSVRDAMRSWQFAAAMRLMDDASAVLRQRAAVEDAAAGVGLTPPRALRRAFEGEDGLVAAAGEGAAELAGIGQIRAAEAARIIEPGLLDWIGLIGADPDARLIAARTAFEAGDQDAAIRGAADAKAAWQAVPEVARGRLVSAALLGLATGLLAWLVAQRRRAGRTRHARRTAHVRRTGRASRP